MCGQREHIPDIKKLKALALKIKSNFLNNILNDFSSTPPQNITWKLLGLNKGKNKTLYQAINKSRFSKASSRIHDRMLNIFYIDKDDIYKAMANVTSLPCSASVRNLLWDICTLKWLSPARLNKINDQISPLCPLCGEVGSIYFYFSCSISQYLLQITKQAIRLSGGPNLEMNAKNFFLASPSLPQIGKDKYKTTCRLIANTLEF